jgi:hypothetical protein
VTPVKFALPVLLAPATNYSLVPTIPVSDAFTVLESFTSVNDTAEESLTGVNDAGQGKLTGVNDASKAVL